MKRSTSLPLCPAHVPAQAADEKSEVGKLLHSLMGNPYQLHALRLLLGVGTHPALPQLASHPAEHAAAMAPVTAPGGAEGEVPEAADPQTYAIARYGLLPRHPLYCSWYAIPNLLPCKSFDVA